MILYSIEYGHGCMHVAIIIGVLLRGHDMSASCRDIVMSMVSCCVVQCYDT